MNCLYDQLKESINGALTYTVTLRDQLDVYGIKFKKQSKSQMMCLTGATAPFSVIMGLWEPERNRSP